MKSNSRSTHIRQTILAALHEHPRDIASYVAEKMGISRQAINKHIRHLIKDGYLLAEGTTRKIYRPGIKRQYSKAYALHKNLLEFEIWKNDFSWLFNDIKKNIFNICDFGFTEMVNNAIDHSQGKKLFVSVEMDPKEIKICIQDDGEGIFNHIARVRKISEPRKTILDLIKGKLTTDPKNHSGQGIFFTSKAFNTFTIHSGTIIYCCQKKRVRVQEDAKPISGTSIEMSIMKKSVTQLKDIFDEYANPENDFAFDKTIIPIRLVEFETGSLMSRSQAKRLLTNLEEFNHIILDFEGITLIGQGFADEIFRVYQKKRPNIIIENINVIDNVKKMIQRVG